MNPDKLFDYLSGNLSSSEREAFEERLRSDEQLQRELAVARRIHEHMRGESREVILSGDPGISERGRKMARRVGIAFIVLMAVNVGAGLWFIARHESKNPNRALLERQMRQQLAQSLEHAAATALSPVPLGVTEITLSAAPGQLGGVADQVTAIAGQLGGRATKGIPEQHRIGLLVDLPAKQEAEFRRKIAVIAGLNPVSPPPEQNSANESETKSFAVEILEATQPPK